MGCGASTQENPTKPLAQGQEEYRGGEQSRSLWAKVRMSSGILTWRWITVVDSVIDGKGAGKGAHDANVEFDDDDDETSRGIHHRGKGQRRGRGIKEEELEEQIFVEVDKSRGIFAEEGKTRGIQIHEHEQIRERWYNKTLDMTRPVMRKNAHDLTAPERKRIVNAWMKMAENEDGIPGTSQYYRLGLIHGGNRSPGTMLTRVPEVTIPDGPTIGKEGPYCVHGLEHFPHWHRVYMLDFEC